MELTTAQKNELATRLIEAQQTNNYDSFNDLVAQLRLTQADFLENFPVLNQAYITEQIGRGAVVPIADEPDIAPFVEEVPTPIIYEPYVPTIVEEFPTPITYEPYVPPFVEEVPTAITYEPPAYENVNPITFPAYPTYDNVIPITDVAELVSSIVPPFVEEFPTPITYESPTVEQQAQSAGLLESEPMTPQNLTEFVFSQMTPAELNAYSMLRESGVNEEAARNEATSATQAAPATQNNIDFSSLPFEFVQEESGGYYNPIDLGGGQQVFKTASGYEISGPSSGLIYDSEGNLVNTYERTGSKTGIIRDTAGNVVGSIDSSDSLNQALGRIFDPLAPAIPAILGSLALGPAGASLFSAPAAAAVASGGSTLLQGGSVEDALKAAALAGLGAYGAQQVTGLLNNAAYDLSFAAADAAQLANQGMSAGAIAQNLATYVDPATAISLANTAATQAFALADAAQLTQQGLNLNQVAQVLESSGINANTAATIAQAAADGVTTLSASDIIPEVQFQRQTNLNQGLLSPADAERVLVTGQAFDVPGIQQLAQGVGAAAFPVVSAVTPGLMNQPADITNQQVQVQAQTGGTQQAATTGLPAAGAGLLTPIQTVPVTSQTGATTQQNVAPIANLLTSIAPTQTVPVTSQTATTTQQSAGPAGAMLGASIAPTQTVSIETRNIPTQERAVTIPVVPSESVSVEGKRESVPTATALIPAGAAGAAAGVTAPATPTNRFSATDAALAALLLSGAGSLLNQGGGAGFTMDPNLANSIINAPRPVSPPGMGGYQMPGMFQIAPTNVYNPFATTAPFGAGRFGGFAAPITLPFGLLATDTNPVGMRLTTPTRGLA